MACKYLEKYIFKLIMTRDCSITTNDHKTEFVFL